MSQGGGKASSWFATAGSSALTSGLGVLSSIVNEVAGSDAEREDLETQVAALQNEGELAAANAALKEKLARSVAYLKPIVEENKALKAQLQALQVRAFLVKLPPFKPPLALQAAELPLNDSVFIDPNADVALLQEALASSHADNRALRINNDCLNESLRQLQLSIDALNEDLAQQQSKSANSGTTKQNEAKHNNSASLSSDMTLRVEMLEANNAALKQDIQLHLDSISHLQSDELNQQLALASCSIEEMKHEVSKLLEENGVLKRRLDAELATSANLREETRHTKDELSGAYADLDFVKQELETHRDQGYQLREQVLRLKDQLALAAVNSQEREHGAESAALAKERETLVASLAQSQNKVNKLASKLKQTIVENKALQAQLKSLNELSSANSATTDSDTCQLELNSLKAQHESLISDHESDKSANTHLTGLLSAAREKESALLTDLHAANESIKSLTNKLKLTTNHVKTLQDDCDFLKSELESGAMVHAETSRALCVHESLNADFRAQVSTLDEALTELESERDQLQQDLGSARESYSAVNTNQYIVSTLSSDRDRLAAQVADLETHLADAGAATSQFEIKIADLESKLRLTTELLNAARTQLTDAQLRAAAQEETLSSMEAALRESSQTREVLSEPARTHSVELMAECNMHLQEIAQLQAEQQDNMRILEGTRKELLYTQSLLQETRGLLQTARAESVKIQLSLVEQQAVAADAQKLLADAQQALEETQLSLADSKTALEVEKIARIEQMYEVKHLRNLESALATQVEHLKQTVAEEKGTLDTLVDEVGTVLVELATGMVEAVDVDSRAAIPLSLKAILNNVKRAVSATGEGPVAERMKAEYEQILVDLNTELEEKNRAMYELQMVNDAVTAEKDRIQEEHSMLMEKLKTFRDTVGPKLQEEMDTNKTLRMHVESLTQQIADLTDEKTLLKSQISELTTLNSTQQVVEPVKDSSSLQEELSVLQVEHEKVTRKFAALQHHMAESEDIFTQDLLRAQSMVDEYKMQLEALERERATWEAMASDSAGAVSAAEVAARESCQDAEVARAQLEEAVRGRERDLISLANLQSVLEEFQASKQSEIDRAIESISKQLHHAQVALEEYRRRATEVEERLQNVNADAPSSEVLEAQLQERNLEIGKLRGKIISLETYLSEAIRRAASADNQVDRRLISNLIVQFMATQRGDPKRFEMLSVIASVLKLNDEDKVKIGLLRRVGAVGAGIGDNGMNSPRSPVGESMTDLWISFLIKEAATEGKDAAAASNTGENPAMTQTPAFVAATPVGNGRELPKRPSSAMFFGNWGGGGGEKKA
ncbi:hypothetical protein BC830DRAFT_1222232 [Chytriomyces sp. MP71]|nr:hypothetical protein BC830DRAFT_1222232 [Chytriomyces sp. MP71]